MDNEQKIDAVGTVGVTPPEPPSQDNKKYFVVAIIVLAIVAAGYFISARYVNLWPFAGDSQLERLEDGAEAAGNTRKLSTIYSPDGLRVAYLEKEWNPDVGRFVRQSVIVEDISSKQRITLVELKLASEEALKYYDLCNDPELYIDVNVYEPVRWVNNDIVLVREFLGDYECSGFIYETFAFNRAGGEFLTPELIAVADYTVPRRGDEPGRDSYDESGWILKNICAKDEGLVIIQKKQTLWAGGYGYVEYDPVTKKFSNQMIEKGKPEGVDTSRYNNEFDSFVNDCEQVTDIEQVKKYFQ